MPRKASTSRAVQDLVRHCHSGLDVPGLQRQLLRSVRRLMPVDAAFFATADPETLLFTGAYAEEPLGAAIPLFLDNEFGSDDVNKFTALAASSGHVASLDTATHSDRALSPRYRDSRSPLGLGRRAARSLVSDSNAGATCVCIAPITRWRQHGGDRAHLQATSPSTHMRSARPSCCWFHGRRHQRAGRLLLADDRACSAATPEAEHLLSLFAESRSGKPPASGRCLYRRRRAGLGREGDGAAMDRAGNTRPHDRRGNGSACTPPGCRDQLVCSDHARHKNADPGTTVPLLLSAYGLSPREGEVAKLVLRGTSTRLFRARCTSH